MLVFTVSLALTLSIQMTNAVSSSLSRTPTAVKDREPRFQVAAMLESSSTKQHSLPSHMANFEGRPPNYSVSSSSCSNKTNVELSYRLHAAVTQVQQDILSTLMEAREYPAGSPSATAG